MRKYVDNSIGTQNLSSKLTVGPRLIRMTFHDALDFNNSITIANLTYNGSQGIDGCLMSS